jgi:hypothetical protein
LDNAELFSLCISQSLRFFGFLLERNDLDENIIVPDDINNPVG